MTTSILIWRRNYVVYTVIVRVLIMCNVIDIVSVDWNEDYDWLMRALIDVRIMIIDWCKFSDSETLSGEDYDNSGCCDYVR